jgi:hypothetical protein
MRLSREKVNHISRLIVENLQNDARIKLLQNANDIRLHIFKIILEQLKIEDEIDAEVRRILNSYSKKITEGSQEWDVMYAKLFEQELNKRNL